MPCWDGRFGSLRSRHLTVWAAAWVCRAGAGLRRPTRCRRLFRSLRTTIRSVLTLGGRRSRPMQSKTALSIGWLKTSAGSFSPGEPPKDGTRAPTLLREASSRIYKAGACSDVSKDRFGGYRGNDVAWVLLPGRTNDVGVNLACYLSSGDAGPALPPGSGRLENLSAFTLAKNSLGAVLAQGPGLVIFDALYRPRETIDSPPIPTTNLSTFPTPRDQRAQQGNRRTATGACATASKPCAPCPASSRTRTTSATAPGRDLAVAMAPTKLP